MVDLVVFQPLWRTVATVMKQLWAAGILFIVDVVFAGVYPNFPTSLDFRSKLEEKDWWETATFYQIYPRSFKDADADGVGDLLGIRDNLAYLKEIGVDATWLSPIFKSPMADFGYDISDYYTVDPIFGTMEDFDALIAKSKETGVRIILDFVPNHSSDENEWFKKSAARDPEYKDYYIWHPGKLIDGVRHPPSNWRSIFRGSAWTWHPERQEYYLHQFLNKQPDLNFRNSKVREAMKDVLRFWLGKGVAGFRIDAVPHLFEVDVDASGNYPDEPRNPFNNDPDDWDYLLHPYTKDLPELYDLIYEWRKVMDDWKKEHGGETKVLLTEAYTTLKNTMKYYGNGTVEGSHIPFNFFTMDAISENSDANQYAQTVNRWLENMPEGRRSNWVMGNHDKNRIANRLGKERMDSINIFLKTLPDISITYYGEEIGMTDVWISWNDTQDPAACNSNPDIFEKFSRDPERTPFQWNDEKNAGFSTANKTWLPISDNYKTVNVKNQRGVAKSHLNIYKELQSLRSLPTFKFGKSEVKAVSNHVLAIVRRLGGERTYIALLNVMGEQENVDLTASLQNIPSSLQYEIVTEKSTVRKGDKVSSTNIKLAPYEAVVLGGDPSSLEKYFSYLILG